MRNRRLIRVLAIVLALLLVGGVVFSAVVSSLAEPATPPTGAADRQELDMEYLTEEQALRVSQRLTYTNRSESRLDAVVFYAAGNMLRRESALMYEPGELERVFYAGYVPGGVDLGEVRFNGVPAEYGFQGAEELYLRVGCDLGPGETGTFEFDYYLLLVRCGAFQGAGELDVRLSAFYFIPGVYDARYGEYIVKRPLPFTRWLYCGAADYAVALTLPEGWLPAGTGALTAEPAGDRRTTWRFSADGVREFAVAFGRRYRVTEGETASGVRVRALCNARGGGQRALAAALEAVAQCEAWFGPFPSARLDIVESDYPLGALNFPGTMWLSTDLLQAGGAEALAQRMRFCVAQQYFGLAAYVEPSADAWLSDSVSAYVAYLLLEASEGRERFIEAVNRDWVSSLQLTIPGGLTVTSDAALFDRYSYEVVVLNRGAVVLHELRRAMGLEPLLEGLSAFVRMGEGGATLTEMDFVAAMNAASGRDWEAFLTDWAFNVGDYVDQTIDWLD